MPNIDFNMISDTKFVSSFLKSKLCLIMHIYCICTGWYSTSMPKLAKKFQIHTSCFSKQIKLCCKWGWGVADGCFCFF